MVICVIHPLGLNSDFVISNFMAWHKLLKTSVPSVSTFLNESYNNIYPIGLFGESSEINKMFKSESGTKEVLQNVNCYDCVRNT